MNQTIEQLLSHRSVRHFKKQALTDKQKQQLITAAQAGSSSPKTKLVFAFAQLRQ